MPNTHTGPGAGRWEGGGVQTSGRYNLYLFGGVVSFASKFLKVVAMSSAEAEYAAASQTCREMTYIRNVCGDLGLVLRGRLCLAVDNTAAIAICENPGVTARNKHFSDAVHYVRHEYDHGRIRLVFVTTDKQRAVAASPHSHTPPCLRARAPHASNHWPSPPPHTLGSCPSSRSLYSVLWLLFIVV